mmetsp:Transcript_6535/g.12944  ORF Transcript_6535/g.12944 Transcript_6535/m.12944 type:complete len:121 (-) Transcript_6535:2625-2987(-)
MGGAGEDAANLEQVHTEQKRDSGTPTLCRLWKGREGGTWGISDRRGEDNMPDAGNSTGGASDNSRTGGTGGKGVDGESISRETGKESAERPEESGIYAVGMSGSRKIDTGGSIFGGTESA